VYRHCHAPGPFYGFENGDDDVAGVWKDELDVLRARVYALIKPQCVVATS
jgi:hypothetical protein